VRLRLTIVLCLVASLPAALAAADRPRIAVLGIEARDAGDARSQQRTAGLARALTNELRARATVAYDLAPNAEKDLMEMKLLSDCVDEAPGCMAAIGRDLDADVLLYGHVEKQREGGYRVWLGSIVVASQKPGVLSLARTVPAADAGEAGMRALGPLIFPDATEEPTPRLPAAHDTAVIVETNVAEGNILIDGAQRGVVTATKTTVIRGLPPGRVMLAVEAPGYQRSEIAVDIREGQAARATLQLEALPPAKVAVTAPVPVQPVGGDEVRPGSTARVMFWTSLVATGAGVAAFTITGLQVRSIEKEQNDALAGFNYQANGVQFPNDACREAAADGYQELIDICDRGRSMATVTNVLIGATAVAAVATAVFYWRGYLAGNSKGREVASRKKPSRLGNIVVSPELYRGGGGIGAVIQF